MIERNNVLEISQVANGFIVRRAMGRWYNDNDQKYWDGSTDDYKVFRTMEEMLEFLSEHFTHRAIVTLQDMATLA